MIVMDLIRTTCTIQNSMNNESAPISLNTEVSSFCLQQDSVRKIQGPKDITNPIILHDVLCGLSKSPFGDNPSQLRIFLYSDLNLILLMKRVSV